MENNSQAIEIKGIVRNQTKIGVQDGQCDDIVNLRFKDGSWRVADDGKVVYTMDRQYKDLHIHTNSTYRNVLGVDPEDSTLYWFANIEEDCETFIPLEQRVAILNNVQGGITIAQTGHLITIANGDDTRYAIFMVAKNEYRVINVNANGSAEDRTIYPFGKVHFNIGCENNEKRHFVHEDESAGKIKIDDSDINYNDSGALIHPNDATDEQIDSTKLIWHSSMLKVFNEAQEANVFTRPILALVTAKLHDGSYVYASNPILLFPREKYTTYKNVRVGEVDIEAEELFFQTNGSRLDGGVTDIEYGGVNYKCYSTTKGTYQYYKLDNQWSSSIAPCVPIYTSGAYAERFSDATAVLEIYKEESSYLKSDLRGYDIYITFGDLTNIISNKDIFSGLSIFITQEVNVYNMAEDGYKKGRLRIQEEFKDNNTGFKFNRTLTANAMYKPEIRDDKDIIYDLMNSPFYLLREYNIDELKSMNNTSTLIDLSEPQYKGLLKAISTQEVLPNEALERKSFKPKFIYNYNQRLHIANYETEQFQGYPIDLFQFSNHNVKREDGSYAAGGVLPDLKDEGVFQYPRTKTYFAFADWSHMDEGLIAEYVSKSLENGTCFASIGVSIDTQQGEQKVCRYIKPYDSNSIILGESNFVESLSPLLAFPDARATKMVVKVISLQEGEVVVYAKTFTLKPHAYLNFAYYIDPSIKPIELPLEKKLTYDQFINSPDADFRPNQIENDKEIFANGLKVSLVNNPFTFPYEATYQVGSSEIVALMSNAVAIGTGQTGDAPLYVFCKDGIYVLIVDPSGTMTYTNQPPIARDVCNNAKSVTPIDNGVVFTSDRGLMSIAGDKVIEIGSAAEGDVFDITDTSDKAKKIMFNVFTMQQLAEFPQSLVDNTDFLTYLKGAIVNYNHNERELMVSNPNKDYTYVMDRYGNWSRRAFTAQEYVNNYPTSYRIDKAGNFYKVDADDNDTNKVYLLSNIIKLGTIAFKQAYRLVVRGYFETEDDAKLGLYVFGSYDGRQWALLGGNEKDQTYSHGKFTDIGCKISHTDIRFLRVCLAGKLSKDTRIDYIEVSADGSALNGKLR